MFPIHDRHGRIIGFGGRAIEAEQKPKYLNSPETAIFQKSRELYGLHQALQHKPAITSIIVVEGYMDVIALAQHGIPNAVATLGTATSSYHIQLLSKYTKQIIFCFDGDTAGRQAAWRALESSLAHLNSGLDASFIFLPEGHDPDSLVRKEGRPQFLERLKNAMPLNTFFIETLTHEKDNSTLAGKSQLVNAAKPYLLKMSDGPYKQLMLDELARLTRIEPHRIDQLMKEHSTPNVQNENKHITRSPVRVAIALLLQHPELYAECESLVPPDMLDAQKQRVLKTLMQQVREHPAITTAQLVEAWRDTPLFEAISKLAAWEHQVPDNALKNELIDIVYFLAKQNREKLVQHLIKKAHEKGLTEDERHSLQKMLQRRHQTFDDKTLLD